MEMWVGACAFFDEVPESSVVYCVFDAAEFCVTDIEIVGGERFGLNWFFFMLEVGGGI